MATAIPTDNSIRKNIAAIINDALALLYIGQDIFPRVHDRWLFSLNNGENAALLRSLDGIYKAKVHAWMVGTDSIARTRADLKDGFGTGSMQKIGINRRDVGKTYKVCAFMQVETGDSDSNSEQRFIHELEYVADAIDKEPMLRLIENSFRGHGALQFTAIDTFPFGDTRVHVATGQLTCHLQRGLL